MGVSTTPVREAFALLQARGLVRVDPHRGAIVRRPTPDDVRESYEIREALETLAGTLALPRVTPQLIDELQNVLDEMRGADDQDRWVELNDRFHLGLYEASGRARLCSMIANLRVASAAYVHMFISQKARGHRADQEHEAILQACRDSDATALDRSIRLHLRNTAEELIKFLDQPDAAAKP